MIDTERCPEIIGGMRCTEPQGHDTGHHPTPHHAEKPLDELPPDLNQLIAGWIDTVEAERAGLRRARILMYTFAAVNLVCAIWNISMLLGRM